MSEINNKEIKQETIVYEKVKMDQLLQLLNSLSVTGVNQANILCNIFNIINSPISVGDSKK
jgi:hypothetical protein